MLVNSFTSDTHGDNSLKDNSTMNTTEAQIVSYGIL